MLQELGHTAMNTPTLFALVTALTLAVTDLRTGRMPNWITMGSFGAALGVRWLVEGQSGIVAGLLGAFIVAAIPLCLFLFTRGQAIGGGDVKALGALGAWLGPTAGLEAEMLGFVFLAVFALVRESVRGRGAALVRRSFALVLPFRGSGNGPQGAAAKLEMRFGPTLFLGTLVVCAARLSEG